MTRPTGLEINRRSAEPLGVANGITRRLSHRSDKGTAELVITLRDGGFDGVDSHRLEQITGFVQTRRD